MLKQIYSLNISPIIEKQLKYLLKYLLYKILSIVAAIVVLVGAIVGLVSWIGKAEKATDEWNSHAVLGIEGQRKAVERLIETQKRQMAQTKLATTTATANVMTARTTNTTTTTTGT